MGTPSALKTVPLGSIRAEKAADEDWLLDAGSNSQPHCFEGEAWLLDATADSNIPSNKTAAAPTNTPAASSPSGVATNPTAVRLPTENTLVGRKVPKVITIPLNVVRAVPSFCSSVAKSLSEKDSELAGGKLSTPAGCSNADAGRRLASPSYGRSAGGESACFAAIPEVKGGSFDCPFVARPARTRSAQT